MEDNILVGDFERDQIDERLGKLKGGYCMIKAGGTSEVEIQECRDRIEDALFAVRAALQDGYVVGGGFALLKSSQNLDLSECSNEYQKIGFEIVKKVCAEPAKQIITNAFGSREKAEVIVQNVNDHHLANLDADYGFNARANKYEDMYEAGIIDPVKVVKNAL